jgi:hypothetical protein
MPKQAKKQKPTGLEYIQDEQQSIAIFDFIDERSDLQQQMEDTLQGPHAELRLPEELPAKKIPGVAPPPSDLTEKEMRKQQAEHKSALEKQKQERKKRGGRIESTQAFTLSVLSTDMPNLLAFPFQNPNLFSAATFQKNRPKLESIYGSLSRMDRVLNENKHTVVLDSLTNDQRQKLDRICQLRGPFLRLLNATLSLQTNQSEEVQTTYAQALEEFNAAASQYAESRNALVTNHLMTWCKQEMPGVLDDAAKERDKDLKAHKEYAWMGETYYIKEHRDVLQRAKTIREVGPNLTPQIRALSEKLFGELTTLGNAAGQLDIHRRAFARGSSAMRNNERRDMDTAFRDQTLNLYQHQIDILNRRMSLVESALAHLHQNRVLGAGTAELLRRDFGFDAVANETKVVENARYYVDTLKTKNDMLQRLLAETNWGLYSKEAKIGFLNGPYANQCHTLMIPGNQEASKKNLDLLIRVAAETGVTGVGSLPGELYDEVKALIARNMEREFTFDVDSLSGESEDRLMARQPELTEAVMQGQILANLGKLRLDGEDQSIEDSLLEERYYGKLHQQIVSDTRPTYITIRDWNARRPSVLEGYKPFTEEYMARKSMLQGALDHTRGLALSRANQMGLFHLQEMTTDAERKRYDSPFPDVREQAILKELVENGRKEMDLAKQMRPKKEALDVPLASLAILQERLDAKEKLEQDRHLETAELYAQIHDNPRPDDEPETILMRKRVHTLMTQTYRMAGDENSTSMPEMLFRAFGPFNYPHAVQAMSKEDYNQMLLDLSAGYDVTPQSTEAEKEAARQVQRRGLATMRGVLFEHYDYLFRKYGLCGDSIDLRSLSEHYSEFMQDIASIQTDLYMTDLPGFLDPENPQDVLLNNRILHYAGLRAYQSFIASAINPDFSEESAKAEMLTQNFHPTEAEKIAAIRAITDHIGENPTTTVRWNEPPNAD